MVSKVGSNRYFEMLFLFFLKNYYFLQYEENRHKKKLFHTTYKICYAVLQHTTKLLFNSTIFAIVENEMTALKWYV